MAENNRTKMRQKIQVVLIRYSIFYMNNRYETTHFQYFSNRAELHKSERCYYDSARAKND